jgi:hypothetical protein
MHGDYVLHPFREFNFPNATTIVFFKGNPTVTPENLTAQPTLVEGPTTPILQSREFF